jgi:hypothetical protein
MSHDDAAMSHNDAVMSHNDAVMSHNDAVMPCYHIVLILASVSCSLGHHLLITGIYVTLLNQFNRP